MSKFRRLMPHQKRGLAWACRNRDQRLAILWDMRLGKTLLTIRWIERMQHLPALIICPLAVLPNWQLELRAEGHGTYDLHDPKTRKFINDFGPGPRDSFHIANYETIRNNPELCRFPWQAVVLDESPIIRNPQAKITKICTSRFKHVPARALLSGYPTPSRLLEIFPQLQFLYGQYKGYKDFWSFRKDYYEPHFTGYGWQPKKGTLDTIQRDIHSLGSVLRRKDVGIGSSVITETRYAELPPQLRKEYLKIEKEFARSDGSTTKWKVVIDNWLRKLCGGPHKDKLLLDLLEGELEGEKAVVWFAYNEDLRRIQSLLRKKGRTVSVIHGGVSVPDRKIAIKRFNGPGANIMLANVGAGRYGQDFSAADTAIYYSLNYDNDHYQQSKERIIHPLKGGMVLLVHLITKDSIEEDVWTALQTKQLEGGLSRRPVWGVTSRRLGKA